MNVGQRRAATEYFESLRGAINRNLGYAGIAASWALRESNGKIVWQLIAAMMAFATYLVLDAVYVHCAAERERRQLKKSVQVYVAQDKGGNLPDDDYRAPYSQRDGDPWECVVRWRGLLLAVGYGVFIYGAIMILSAS